MRGMTRDDFEEYNDLKERHIVFFSNNEELKKDISLLAYGHLYGTKRKYDLDPTDVLADARTPYNWGLACDKDGISLANTVLKNRILDI